MSDRKLIILGTASQVPGRERNQNGYFLRFDDEGFLFDPGEGGNYIQILDPNGFPVNFSYRTADGASGLTGSGTQLDVSGCNASMTQIGPNRASNCKFNERFVILTVDLPANYATAYAARWWKINYVFTSAVTDRSTWSVRIIGDPVHISN